MEKITSMFLDNLLPLGHGAALQFPEYPFQPWEYVNGLGQKVTRDNPCIYLEASQVMYDCINKFREKMTGSVLNEEIPEKDLELIYRNINSFRDEDPEIRHQQWIQSILQDDFSFTKELNESIQYIPKGVGSWKHMALNTDKYQDEDSDIFEYRQEFLSSDWKSFHVAIQKHRLEVLHDILPNYGICSG